MSEAQMDEGPLVKLSGQPEATAQGDQPIPLHEQPKPAADTAETPVRPDNFPAKFWTDKGPDVDKLAKSYSELEKQFKSGKHKAPETDYDLAPLVDKGVSEDDPMLSTFKDWAKETGISQAAFEDIVGKISEITGKQVESFEIDRKAEMAKLGERAREKIEMVERHIMKLGLSNEERDAIASGLDNASSINAMVKMIQSFTNENLPVAPAVNTPAMTRADLEAAMQDPRYGKDRIYTDGITSKWMKAQNA